jgi:Domain of unknown function (DUF4430)
MHRRRPGATPVPSGRSVAAVVAILLVGVVLVGCGIGSGEGTKGTSLSVTRDFGEQPLLDTTDPKTDGQDTVMRLLQRNAKVTTRYGGGFVQSIDGKAGSTDSDPPVDWMYYVNGVEAPKGAASTEVHNGDRVWWDLHSWQATQHIPAVVGSYPEPFIHGIDGKRLPVLVECADLQSPGCDQTVKSLADLGVVSARNRIRSSFVKESLRVLVGPWIAVRDEPIVQRMEQGPAASGVYAKPAADGKTITVLHPDGSNARVLGPGSGLIAATAADGGFPIWVITGTDAAGVTAAADALDEGNLKDRFALAVSAGQGVHVPEQGP